MNRISSIAVFLVAMTHCMDAFGHPGHTALDKEGLMHFIVQPDHLPLNLLTSYIGYRIISHLVKRRGTVNR